MIRKDWEIFTLQFITLSIAIATAIIVVSFTYHEFNANNSYHDNVFRILRHNKTKEYEGQNRLSDRIPSEIRHYLFKTRNPHFDWPWRVKALSGHDLYALDQNFSKHVDRLPYKTWIPYDTAEISNMGYDPADHSIFVALVNEDSLTAAQAYLNKAFPDPSFSYILQPASEIYFGPRVIGESLRHGDLYCVIILICIGALIVILAATNFVNLVTLTLPGRAKELAMRKVAGAQRLPLLNLLAKENIAIIAVSLIIAVAILLISAGPAKELLSVDLSEWIGNNTVMVYFLLIVLFATIAAAPVLPAWAFVKASPGRLLGTDTITFPRMKNVITIVQLGVSISLIIASLVIDRQISRSLIKEPGKNHDQVIYLPYPAGLTKSALTRLKTEWPVNNPNILGLTAVSHTPDNLTSRPVEKDYYRLNVDFDFKDFFGLQMAKGRWFSANDNDSTIVNEAFRGEDSTKIGVVKNFAGTYNLPDKPVRITVDKDEYNFLMIRVLEVNVRSTLKVVSNFFEEVSGRPVTLSFLDKNYAARLAYEDRLNNLSSLLATVSLVMACCAIYALSLARMRDNLKQIAIRKTFGASDRQIVQRLSWQFLELMLGSLCLFGPITYFLLREWLRNFAYSAKFDWSDPIISIGICLVIVGITNLFLLGRINNNTLKDLLRR